ncbi:alpha/beta fold hydrolase [Pseudonocardia endophytica]|uniref:Alpha/beta hydrolase family protein n=1 Tax=Pseudonocardia endophytica TaxID=401976 RepID=A0A4R1HYS4_PSEEN|nr:alpha/beta fold hydrolase [Pseudonocardia endophytica]TCK26701.1 alpha/beta hydrolase family protein [Pseudonocardia endophytica]
MSTYVLIPGMNHGGWCFDDLAARLRAEGHTVHALTLPGLTAGDDVSGVNLETHIAAAASVVADLEDVLLVGHSYGGMIVSGVADRLPEHVDSVVYLDAFVPRDGENCWMQANDAERAWYTDDDGSGFAVPTLPFFDERALAHPRATLMQRIHLSGDLSRFRRRVYLYATEWPGESPMRASYERVRDDATWEVHVLSSAHNFMRDVPEKLAAILLDLG